MPQRLTVFLCHASQDKAQVRQIHSWLKDQGFAPWLDEVDLLPGTDWREAIRASIASSDIFLALLTQNSISKRGFVQAEIRTALEELQNVPTGQTYVVPARLSQCDIPSELSHLHVADLTTTDGKDNLLRALNQRASQLGRLNLLPQAEVISEHHRRIEAINFVLAHDHGQVVSGLEDADLILIGLSRSGITPLSVYLATQHGIKVANYPLTPEDLERGSLPKPIRPYLPKTVALVVEPDALATIRSQRRPRSRYASLANCEHECAEYLKLVTAGKVQQLTGAASGFAVEELAMMILRNLRPDRLII